MLRFYKIFTKIFDHNYRISWSRIENVKKVSQIYHPTVKGLLTHLNLNKEGLEIHYDGDLPGNSGIGSSSSFCVGLISALNKKYDFKFNKKKIAEEAYYIELCCCWRECWYARSGLGIIWWFKFY